jgi:hypothetical protein
MMRTLLKHSLIVLVGTLAFLCICATVGISTSNPPASATAKVDSGPHGPDVEDISRITQKPRSRLREYGITATR